MVQPTNSFWPNGVNREDYGFGKPMPFPNIPWGERGKRQLVPLIPDFAGELDPDVENPVLLHENTRSEIDHSHKRTFSRFGHFSAMFDQRTPKISTINPELSNSVLLLAMLAWRRPLNLEHPVIKLALPTKSRDNSIFSIRAASKNTVVGLRTTKENKHTVFIFTSAEKHWRKTKLVLEGKHGIAISDEGRFVATYCGLVVQCWSIENGQFVHRWALKGEAIPNFDSVNNFNVAVSQDYVVFERPSSLLQTHSVEKNGEFVCSCLSTPTVTSLSVHCNYLLIGGAANTYQRMVMRENHWIPEFFRAVVDYESPVEPLRLPLEFFRFCRVRGDKILLCAKNFLLAADLDEIRPIYRLFKGVYSAAEIVGDYLALLQKTAPQTYLFTLSDFLHGDVVHQQSISVPREQRDIDSSFILATATIIHIVMFTGRVYTISTGMHPIKFATKAEPDKENLPQL